jgi:hypothetical protein
MVGLLRKSFVSKRGDVTETGEYCIKRSFFIIYYYGEQTKDDDAAGDCRALESYVYPT